MPFNKSLVLLFIVILGGFHRYDIQAADSMRSPFNKGSQNKFHSEKSLSLFDLTALTTIRFFSRVISPADGPRSPSYPTGSAYGKMAIEQHGALMGILLIGDRLFHEADIHQGPLIRHYNKIRYYDPLESNTFWWEKSVP